MGAIERNPSNRDILQSTKFKLNFMRLPGLTFFCQTANLPGISLTEIQRPTPFVDLWQPGEKAIYDTLNVTMLVEERMGSRTVLRHMGLDPCNRQPRSPIQ